MEDLWDWCCTEVYRLPNGKDVWNKINEAKDARVEQERKRVIGVLEKHIENFGEFGVTKEYILNRLIGVLNQMKGVR